MITAEVLVQRNHRKFIPILRKGAWEQASPSWLLGKRYVDLRGEPYPEEAYTDLLTTLLRARPNPSRLGEVRSAHHHTNLSQYSRETSRPDGSSYFDLPEAIPKGLTIDAVDNLVQTRKLVETSLIETAFSAITEQELVKLENLLQRMKRSMTDGDVHSFSKHDMDFHLELAAISRNPFLSRILTQIRALFLFQEKLLISMPSVMGAALRAHESILSALQKKEHSGARSLLQEHLTKVERNWFNLKSEIFRQQDTVPEDWQSLSSVFELRQTIEGAAIRHQRYAPVQPPPIEPCELLKNGRFAARSGNIPAYARFDVGFHLNLVEQCNAPFLSRIINSVSHIMAFQFLMIMALPKAMEHSNGEHEAVCDALKRRDWASASASLNHHIVRESQMWNTIIKNQKWARKE